MKLIIDIPEEVYAECRGDIYFPDTGGELFNAVKNGTPLDDVKAEIEQKARPYEIGGRGNGKSIRYGLCMALQILDNIGKAESEGE